MVAVLASAAAQIHVKQLGCFEYAAALEAMREFTARRGGSTPDELWLLEHPPVYTLGLAADPSHGPRQSNGIAVVRVERGGQITYHGPGQVVLYAMVDLARRRIKVHEFVRLLEQSVIDLLEGHGVQSTRRPGAPGVYVEQAKIAALGIRVSRGCAFHGLSLNVDIDLTPFDAIDPCGYPGLAVTRTRDLGIDAGTDVLGLAMAQRLMERLEDA